MASQLQHDEVNPLSPTEDQAYRDAQHSDMKDEEEGIYWEYQDVTSVPAASSAVSTSTSRSVLAASSATENMISTVEPLVTSHTGSLIPVRNSTSRGIRGRNYISSSEMVSTAVSELPLSSSYRPVSTAVSELPVYSMRTNMRPLTTSYVEPFQLQHQQWSVQPGQSVASSSTSSYNPSDELYAERLRVLANFEDRLPNPPPPHRRLVNPPPVTQPVVDPMVGIQNSIQNLSNILTAGMLTMNTRLSSLEQASPVTPVVAATANTGVPLMARTFMSSSGFDPPDPSDPTDSSNHDSDNNNSRNRTSSNNSSMRTTYRDNNVNVVQPHRSILTLEYEIPQADITNSLNLTSVKRAYEIYTKYRNSHADKSKPFVLWFSEDAHKALLDKQYALDTTAGLTINPQTIVFCKNEDIDKFLTDFLRPITYMKYVEKLQKAMTKPKWDHGQKWEIRTYNTKIFRHVTRLIDEYTCYDHFMRRGSTPLQLEVFPRLTWGKKGDNEPGLFRILMKMLGPFEPNFVIMLKEEVLKNLTTLEQFTNLLKSHNSELSKKSIEMQRQEEIGKVQPSLNEIFRESSQKSIGQPEKRPFNGFRKRTDVQPSTRNRLNRNQAMEDEQDEQFDKDFKNQVNNAQNEDYDEEQDEELPDIFEDEEVPDEPYDFDDCDIDQAIHFLHFMRPTSGVGRPTSKGPVMTKNGPIHPDKPNLKVFACFKETFGSSVGKCPLGTTCPYSHDINKIKDALHESYAKTCNSFAWDSTIPRRLVKKVSQLQYTNSSDKRKQEHSSRDRNVQPQHRGQNGNRNHRLDSDLDSNQQKPDSSTKRPDSSQSADQVDDEDN